MLILLALDLMHFRLPAIDGEDLALLPFISPLTFQFGSLSTLDRIALRQLYYSDLDIIRSLVL